MNRLLKRWAALPVAIAWLPLYFGIVVVSVGAGLWWLVTGKSVQDFVFGYMEFVIQDYWGAYADWARR